MGMYDNSNKRRKHPQADVVFALGSTLSLLLGCSGLVFWHAQSSGELCVDVLVVFTHAPEIAPAPSPKP